jgi:hypothetical protein
LDGWGRIGARARAAAARRFERLPPASASCAPASAPLEVEPVEPRAALQDTQPELADLDVGDFDRLAVVAVAVVDDLAVFVAQLSHPVRGELRLVGVELRALELAQLFDLLGGGPVGLATA